MKKYEIQFLNDDEFNSLPFQAVEQAMGVADSHSQTAYVRKTGIMPLDLYTAAHELEHLEDSGCSDHEYFGDGRHYFAKAAFPAILGALATGAATAGGGALVNKLMAPKQQAQQPQSQPQVMPTQSAALNQFGGSKPNIIAPQAASMGGGSMTAPQGGPIDMLKKNKGNYSGGMM